MIQVCLRGSMINKKQNHKMKKRTIGQQIQSSLMIGGIATLCLYYFNSFINRKPFRECGSCGMYNVNFTHIKSCFYLKQS